MTVITESYRWSDMVDPYHEAQEQVHGYDFSLDKVYRMVGRGELRTDGKQLPTYISVDPVERKFYLSPGIYIAEMREVVSLPKDVMGYMRPRSSLIRMGATLETAVWDAGYTGKSSTLLVVSHPSGVLIHQFAPIGQMVLHRTESSTAGYDGQYQFEGIEDSDVVVPAHVFVGHPDLSPRAARDEIAFQEATRGNSVWQSSL